MTFGLKASALSEQSQSESTFDPGAERDGQRYQTLQFVGYGVGAALVAAGVTTFVLGSLRKEGVTADKQLSLVPHTGGVVAVFGSAF